ncbi:VOC family protein [Nakamurella sp. PAMC28650]|uniref:VOC family protein n=1 Tax=Nakamurella sp. PAMC28650 TaxID=2762325 RepID=UPI00164EACA3|nr:VOC family protein [Nakamurella sp. PAMC28650]QNK81853.1 VOC family protein [Nakamurella sp. PAMC28650]
MTDSPPPLVTTPSPAPSIRQVVLDCPDARALAEFYRQLFGLRYRQGDEPPAAGEPDPRGRDWLVLRDPGGSMGVAFQQVPDLPALTWPTGSRPQMLHLDTTVPTAADLTLQVGRAIELGARQLYDRSDDPEEPLFVLADPAGHPFCLFVAV